MYFHLEDWFPIFFSLRIAFISLLMVTCIGLPVARLLARIEFPGKEILEAAITLPLVLPPSVIGYGLLILIGKNGIIGKFLMEMGITLVFTWWAAILASTVVALSLIHIYMQTFVDGCLG